MISHRHRWRLSKQKRSEQRPHAIALQQTVAASISQRGVHPSTTILLRILAAHRPAFDAAVRFLEVCRINRCQSVRQRGPYLTGVDQSGFLGQQ